MSAIRKLDFDAETIGKLYAIDPRKAMVAHFIAASIGSMDNLSKIVKTAEDLMPNVWQGLMDDTTKRNTVGAALGLATQALEELTGRKAVYTFADPREQVLLGVELPALPGGKSLIYDLQKGDYLVAHPIDWETRAKLELNVQPTQSAEASYAF